MEIVNDLYLYSAFLVVMTTRSAFTLCLIHPFTHVWQGHHAGCQPAHQEVINQSYTHCWSSNRSTHTHTHTYFYDLWIPGWDHPPHWWLLVERCWHDNAANFSSFACLAMVATTVAWMCILYLLYLSISILQKTAQNKTFTFTKCLYSTLYVLHIVSLMKMPFFPDLSY